MGSLGALFTGQPTGYGRGMNGQDNSPQSQFNAQAAQNQNGQNATTMNQYDYGSGIQQGQDRQSGTYGAQNDLLNTYKNMIAGNGPSVANTQLQQSLAQNQANQAGAVASARGINPFLQSRMILNNGANLSQQAAGQAALNRVQEQLGAMSGASNLLGQQQTGNLGLYTAANSANQSQNALALQNQQGQQNLAQKTAAENAQNKIDVAKANASGNAQTTAATEAMVGNAASGAGGSMLAGGLAAAHGAVVPGHAAHPGNDSRNDTVDAKLSPEEIVLPRSITMAEDAPDKAYDFVKDILMKRKKGKGYVKAAGKGK